MGTGATSGAVFRSIVLAASAVTSHRVAAALAIAAIAVDTAIKAALATATMHSHPLNRLLSAICVSFARIVFPAGSPPVKGSGRFLLNCHCSHVVSPIRPAHVKKRQPVGRGCGRGSTA